MKVFVVSMLCAVLSGAACSVVGWPGAIPLSASYVRSVIPPQIKAFGYSTSQYINSAPPTYTLGYQPQISNQIPVSLYYPQQTFAPIVSHGYYPSDYYPSYYPTLNPAAPISPISPIGSVQPPQAQLPSFPAQPIQGDEDTAIVDSAEFPGQQQSLQQEQQTQTPEQPSAASMAEPSLSPPGSAPAGNDEDTVSIESA